MTRKNEVAFVRKIKAGLVKQESNEFIGEDGTIFYDIDSGEFRLSDGVTPGGIPLSGGSLANTTVLSQPFSQWATGNDILANGQLGYDETNDELRVGDGTSVWTALDPITAQAQAMSWNSTNW